MWDLWRLAIELLRLLGPDGTRNIPTTQHCATLARANACTHSPTSLPHQPSRMRGCVVVCAVVCGVAIAAEAEDRRTLASRAGG